MKPPDIFDRRAEWAALEKMQARRRPELVVVVGRRRVGKSFVLSRFAREVGGVYYQATRRTSDEQLAQLGRLVGERFGDDALAAGATLPTWEVLFDYLASKSRTKRCTVILDEFPYLVEAVPALPSIVQRYWDHAWQDTKLRLVLSGSYVSAMQQLEASDQPLYGRRTARIAFAPFEASSAAEFVPDWSPREQLKLCGTVGQLPGHLALVDPDISLGENIAELMLSPNGRLVDEAEHLLDAFVPNAQVHYSIVAAIAGGDRTWSGITSRVGRSGGSITRPVQWLEEMQLVERVVPITEKNPERSKRTHYRIVDPYLAFWHTAVAQLLRRGSIGLADPQLLWDELVEPRVDDHMGDVFENLCREWIVRTASPFAPVRIGSWWDAKSRNEVDIVALSADGELFVGECKWGGVKGRHLATLRDRAKLVERELREPVSKIHYGLFTGNGEADDVVKDLADEGKLMLVGPGELVSA